MTKEELQSKIAEIIHKDNECIVTFEWHYSKSGEVAGSMQNDLRIYTMNPKHKRTFLLYSQRGFNTQEQMLETAVKRIEGMREGKFNSYTVTWNDEEKNKLNNSYFYARDMGEVLKRLQLQDSNINIHQIKLNPES